MKTDARGYPVLPPENPKTMAEIIRRQVEALEPLYFGPLKSFDVVHRADVLRLIDALSSTSDKP